MDRKGVLKNAVSQAIKMPKLTQEILADIEMDELFEELVEKYKNANLTPLEMDLRIQADRILYVLNKCLAKCRLLAFLPYLLDDDAKIIRKYLPLTERAIVLEICNRFGACFDINLSETKWQEFILELESMNPEPNENRPINITKQRPSMPVKLSYLEISAAQMIDILFYNECIQGEIQNAKEPKFNKDIMKIIHILQDFRDIVKEKIYVTGDEEKAVEKKLRMTYKTNLLLKNTLKELKKKLEKQQQELGQQLKKSIGGFQMYIDKMDEVKLAFQFQMTDILHNSEKAMMRKSMESEEVQAQLSKEADTLVKEYDSLLNVHLSQERVLRGKRLKLETQLQNWLNTFDQDVGEKYAEYEVLKKEYDKMNAKKEQLENEMDEQEEEYLALMEEKRIEEERLYQEMAYQYLLNRSARMIQQYWRAYRQRKALRKKGKKGKGKDKTPAKPLASPPIKSSTVVAIKSSTVVAIKSSTVVAIKSSKVVFKENMIETLEKDMKAKSHVFEELKDVKSQVFSRQNLVVDLDADDDD